MSAVFKSIATDWSENGYIYDLPDSLFVDGGKLEMGDKVRLRVSGLDVQYKARLMGAVPGESMMLALEGVQADLLRFPLGTDVFCSYVSSEAFLMFKGKVLKSGMHPFPHVEMSYPHEVQSIASKRDVRFDVDLVAILHKPSSVEKEEQVVTAKLLNLGCGGTLAASLEPIAMVGDEVDVAMLLPCADHKVDVKLKAKVKNIRNAIDAEGVLRFYYGVEFIEVGLRDSLCVKSYLFDNLEKVPSNRTHRHALV